MKAYIGFDLGTTNVKALIITEKGKIGEVISCKTPVSIIDGVRYYNIALVEKEIENIISQIRKKYAVQAISFTSIGESVVPIKNGKLLHPPIMWDDMVTQQVYNEIGKHLAALSGYEKTGVQNNCRFSAYKIVWMEKNLSLGAVDFYLPISSYFLYKYTKTVAWAESQACRTYLYDIHKREWNSEVVSFLGLQGKLGPISYTGEIVGTDEFGTVYGQAGHDHITGMFGAYLLSESDSIVYDSMGTSSVLGALITTPNISSTYTKPFFNGVSGVIGAAFADSQYYIQNSFRYFGYVMDRIAVMSGNEPSSDFYNSINKKIDVLESAHPKAVFSIGGDCLLGVGKEKVNILNFPIDITLEELMQSAYVYLCSMSRMIYESVTAQSSLASEYIAGGKIAHDATFMRYKASMLQRPITILDTNEITALGAALAAIQARGDRETLAKCKQEIGKTVIEPEKSLSAQLAEAYKVYQELGESPALQYFQ